MDGSSWSMSHHWCSSIAEGMCVVAPLSNLCRFWAGMMSSHFVLFAQFEWEQEKFGEALRWTVYSDESCQRVLHSNAYRGAECHQYQPGKYSFIFQYSKSSTLARRITSDERFGDARRSQHWSPCFRVRAHVSFVVLQLYTSNDLSKVGATISPSAFCQHPAGHWHLWEKCVYVAPRRVLSPLLVSECHFSLTNGFQHVILLPAFDFLPRWLLLCRSGDRSAQLLCLFSGSSALFFFVISFWHVHVIVNLSFPFFHITSSSTQWVTHSQNREERGLLRLIFQLNCVWLALFPTKHGRQPRTNCIIFRWVKQTWASTRLHDNPNPRSRERQ